MHDCAANQDGSMSRRGTQVYTYACTMFARLIKKRGPIVLRACHANISVWERIAKAYDGK